MQPHQKITFVQIEQIWATSCARSQLCINRVNMGNQPHKKITMNKQSRYWQLAAIEVNYVHTELLNETIHTQFTSEVDCVSFYSFRLIEMDHISFFVRSYKQSISIYDNIFLLLFYFTPSVSQILSQFDRTRILRNVIESELKKLVRCKSYF